MNRGALRPNGAAARTVREFSLIAGGKAVSLGSILIASVIAARVCGPEQYGLFAAALTLLLLLDATIGAPMDYTAVRFGAMHRGDSDRVARFQSATFRIKLGLGLAVVIAALPFAGSLSSAIFEPQAGAWLLWVTFGSTLALLLLRGTAAHLQIQTRFRAYWAIDTAHGALRIVGVGMLAAMGAGAAAQYLGVFGAAAAIVFLLGVVIIRQPYLRARWPNRDDARAILSYLGVAVGVIVLGTITGRSDVLVLAALRSSEEVGRYAIAAQLAAVPTMLAGYASVLVQPRLIPAVRAGSAGRLLRAGALIAAAVAVMGAAPAAWLAPWLIPLVLGEAYQSTADVLRVLIIGTSLDMLFMPVAMTFSMQLRPRASLLGEAAITAAFLAAAPFAASAGPLWLAWLATATRAGKCALYYTIMLANLRSAADENATPSDRSAHRPPQVK